MPATLPTSASLASTYLLRAWTFEISYWDKRTPTDQCFPHCRVNGAWPCLAKGVERDRTLSQISRTGRAEKGGAVLTVEPGRMGCVEFEPLSGTFVGYTPLPDATVWKFELPGGITVEPDGKVGMLRVTVMPGPSASTPHAAPTR